jgi:hypothetical protein
MPSLPPTDRRCRSAGLTPAPTAGMRSGSGNASSRSGLFRSATLTLTQLCSCSPLSSFAGPVGVRVSGPGSGDAGGTGPTGDVPAPPRIKLTRSGDWSHQPLEPTIALTPRRRRDAKVGAFRPVAVHRCVEGYGRGMRRRRNQVAEEARREVREQDSDESDSERSASDQERSGQATGEEQAARNRKEDPPA